VASGASKPEAVIDAQLERMRMTQAANESRSIARDLSAHEKTPRRFQQDVFEPSPQDTLEAIAA
jgi:hypothetical protein